MFTGLVEGTAAVLELEPRGPRGSGARLLLGPPALPPELPVWDPLPGESISVSGCCLSVAERRPDGACAYDLSAETLARTRLGTLRPGERLNLERSLRLGDRLGGHLVSGHVDGLGRVAAVEDAGDGGRLVTFEAEPAFARWLVEKGSVAVDGVSLTVVAPEGPRFRVAVIPETLHRTTLGGARPGQAVHLEADQVGKWIERLLAERG